MHQFSLLALLALATLLPATAGLAEKAKSWTDRIKLSGDFRYRHEGIYTDAMASDGNANNLPDRVRHRIRLRIGADAIINRYWDVALRLATSSPTSADVGDPISTNQDLGGGLTPKTIWLDRAYAAFRPVNGLTITGGKFGVPYHFTDLQFDPDLNLEGIVAGAQGTNKDAVLLPFGRLGGYWLQERSTGPDQALFGAQVGARLKQNKLTLTGAAAYYDYSNVKSSPTLFSLTKSFGNTVTDNFYAFDYNLIDINLQFKYQMDKVEAMVLGNYIQNMDPDSDHTAWLAGVALKGTGLFEWDLGYNYRVLESDAVIGAFADSDFGGGGTNAEGHKLWAGVSPVLNTRLGVTWFVNQRDPDGSDLHYERLMADLEVKF